jgi:hypothetical protein
MHAKEQRSTTQEAASSNIEVGLESKQSIR